MYASRFAAGPRFRPISMGVAVAINGGVVAALLLVAPEMIRQRERPPLIIDAIPLEQPKPDPIPSPDTPRTATRAAEHSEVAPPSPFPSPGPFVHVDQEQPIGPATPEPIGTATPAPAELPFIGASIDPRYAKDFQPDYPDTARDTGQEGTVVIRVLIGVDGRVKQVERVSGDAIF